MSLLPIITEHCMHSWLSKRAPGSRAAAADQLGLWELQGSQSCLSQGLLSRLLLRLP